MNPSEFTQDAPGRLIRAAEGYWSFVPAPLPPALDLNQRLLLLLEEAESALGQLTGAARFLPSAALLISPFVRREAVFSSRIEGTTTTLVELYLFETDQKSELDTEDAEEVANYVRALEHGLQRIKTLPISLRLLRELHGLLLQGARGSSRQPGEFRRVPVAIAGPGASLHDARFVPPPVPEMMEALHALETYIHQSRYPTLIEAALIHYQFETIHPFMEGNGRVGRLLITLFLAERGKLSEPLLYLSGYFERHRSDYIDHLLQVSQKGAWDAWISFFLRGVAVQASDGLRRTQRLTELRNDYLDAVRSAGAADTALRMVDMLFDWPITTIRRAADRLEVSYPTASTTVSLFVDLGILEEVTGKQRNRVFAARQIIESVEAPLER